MPGRKPYLHPPLVLAAFEVRHTGADPLSVTELRKLTTLLRSDWPVKRPGRDIAFQFGINPGNTPFGGPQLGDPYTRFFSRDMTSAVVVKTEAISLETTRYPGWDEMQEIIRRVLTARHSVSPLAGYDRVGLRYLNEIRIPFSGIAWPEWTRWVNDSLLGPAQAAGVSLPLTGWQSASTYGPVDGQSLILRYGPALGYALDPNADLKRPKAPPPGGPFFLLDFDSFWQPSDAIPEFQPAELVERCDALHTPVGGLFEALIDDRLRREVFNDDASDAV
jgi:uncharacterized protein (TIGR04255 family)